MELNVLFYILSFLTVISALCVVLSRSPLYSALSLVMTMVSLAVIFYLLQAPFLAGVQLIVYAGAVMVLFVMILMLFDLNKEREIFSFGVFPKCLIVAWFCGLLAGAIYMSTGMTLQVSDRSSEESSQSITQLAQILFVDYVFAFEALGVLLLLIAIGVVAVSRTKGGTHVKS